ncbi:MAG: hypothetical protein ACHREM_20535 [Polyangiales bacterium]
MPPAKDKTKCWWNCGAPTVTSQRETHHYEASGLPNIVLLNIEVRRCSTCGGSMAVLPRVAPLYDAITHAVIMKPERLTGPEVRYLRKYLVWSGVEFALHMGVDPSTVSNWETEKDPIGTASDRLLRLMVVHHAKLSKYSLDELTKISSERRPPTMICFIFADNHWQRAPSFEDSLDGQRVRLAAQCPKCSNFAWDMGHMRPAQDPKTGRWHHPSCKLVPHARAEQLVERSGKKR